MQHLVIVLAILLLQLRAHAATVPHAFAERNTAATTTSSTYSDIPDVAIAAASFTAGKKYRIKYCGQFAEDGSNFGAVRAVHGSTAFAESERYFYRSSTNVDYIALCWMTVWTAVSSEGVKLQFLSSNGTSTATAIFVSLSVIQLTGYLVEGVDYCWAERGNDDALSVTPVDGASCTVTPSAAGTWLAETASQVSRSDTTTRQISRMVRSGEASSSLPASNILPEATTGVWGHYHARTFTLGASSNTIKEQSEAGATAHTRLHSSVFLLNLSKFTAHAAAYTEASQSLTTTTMTNVQTASITPIATADVLIEAAFILDKTAASSDVEFRVQVDGSDQPAGQTTADLDMDQYNAGHTDNDIPLGLTTQMSLSNAAHTINLDANRNTNSDVKYRQVWAFALDIPQGRRRVAPVELP